ncbi:MAG: tRNA (adenosine(37)-N6)-dimethylallyltransferase MiaA [Omnitrophica WOR_2 bacterium GWA2_47_8]|nr:MAG: tRNA (adenosine(37)-N6)-dimethylallyltransferase MiaA [Omnitrophica WOR_2 bacterium GWA2_47_8]
MNFNIIFIVGPTAVGKSDVAFQLAQKINGEIISCDSMQIYKEINIASGKPSKKILEKIPHHLVGVLSVKEDFNVAQFFSLVEKAIQSIHKRKKVPIIVGGSGLYMQVLLDGIFQQKAIDPKLKMRLEKELKEKGAEALYQRLKKVDPNAALRVHPNNTRRLIRALEANALSQEPFSKVRQSRDGLLGKYDIKIFALNRKREELYSRINSRVEKMFDHGIVEEIKALNTSSLSQTAKQLIGVKEVLGYLQGEYDLEKAKYLMQLNTRHFAKRQLTWFRKDKRLEWITIESDEPTQNVVEKIFREVKI